MHSFASQNGCTKMMENMTQVLFFFLSYHDRSISPYPIYILTPMNRIKLISSTSNGGRTLKQSLLQAPGQAGGLRYSLSSSC